MVYISFSMSEKAKRRCDARCLHVKKDECTRICLGLNHKKTPEEAISNTTQLAPAWLAEFQKKTPEAVIEKLLGAKVVPV